jgi:hypothetical protein
MRAIAGASRWAVTAHFAALVAQFGLAVGLLAGHVGLAAHAHNAWVVAGLGTLQGILLLAVGPSAIGRHFAAAVLLGIVVAIAQLRIAWGFSTSVHVSLALLYWGISIAVLIKVWKPDWEKI